MVGSEYAWVGRANDAMFISRMPSKAHPRITSTELMRSCLATGARASVTRAVAESGCSLVIGSIVIQGMDRRSPAEDVAGHTTGKARLREHDCCAARQNLHWPNISRNLLQHSHLFSSRRRHTR